jgi:hypothetical protein
MVADIRRFVVSAPMDTPENMPSQRDENAQSVIVKGE